jgi:predicted NodU family carbamoyl transferase
MIVAAEVRPERRPEIPAVVHIDGSARPQAVDHPVEAIQTYLDSDIDALAIGSYLIIRD